MSNDEIWTKINKWKSKCDDYSTDYWILNSAKNHLAEGVNGLTDLSSTQYDKVKQDLTEGLGELPDLKEKLALTNSNLKINAENTVSDIGAAMSALASAVEEAQGKINYYYGILE